MVALNNDDINKHKLRPLGMPLGIKRIPAAVILYIYKSRFSNHLLPFNYAFSIPGGVDIVASTIY